MLLALLIRSVFAWLPAPIWVCVWVIFAVAMFTVLVKLIGIILDFFFKFIDLFT